MLVLTQAAAGLFAASAAVQFTGLPVHPQWLNGAGFVALLTGLACSILHLGQPLKAWRAFLGWRKSWLSREILALTAFAAVAGPAVLAAITGGPAPLAPGLTLVAAILGFAAVFTSAMVYVDTQRPLWRPRISFGNFYGTTLLLGATFAAVVLGWADHFTTASLATGTQIAAAAALVIRTALFVWRRVEIRSALRHAASPIHLNARVIRELLSWTTSARTWLFITSTLFGLLALADAAGVAAAWASVAALTTFSSEIIGRHVFFAAGMSKRMPGGVVA
jgi:DMSO reductase anchor subunit